MLGVRIVMVIHGLEWEFILRAWSGARAMLRREGSCDQPSCVLDYVVEGYGTRDRSAWSYILPVPIDTVISRYSFQVVWGDIEIELTRWV